MLNPIGSTGVHKSVQVGINLKLYLDLASTLLYTRALCRAARGRPSLHNGSVQLWLAPATPFLGAVRDTIGDAPIELVAQNVDDVDAGPHTGGTCARDLADVGCRRVILGHAERRRLFAEDDAVIAAKARAALRLGLRPVLCVGEPLRGTPDQASARCVEEIMRIAPEVDAEWTVAYEPHWAIGATEAADPEYIAEVIAGIRENVPGVAVIYGGSAGPGLLRRLGAGVDGIFLGRFGHDPDSVAQVLDEAEEAAIATA
jgi:triosephosphate isomerase